MPTQLDLTLDHDSSRSPLPKPPKGSELSPVRMAQAMMSAGIEPRDIGLSHPSWSYATEIEITRAYHDWKKPQSPFQGKTVHYTGGADYGQELLVQRVERKTKAKIIGTFQRENGRPMHGALEVKHLKVGAAPLNMPWIKLKRNQWLGRVNGVVVGISSYRKKFSVSTRHESAEARGIPTISAVSGGPTFDTLEAAKRFAGKYTQTGLIEQSLSNPPAVVIEEPAVQEVGVEDGSGPITVRRSRGEWFVVTGSGNWGVVPYETSKAAKVAAKKKHKENEKAKAKARATFKSKKAPKGTPSPVAMVKVLNKLIIGDTRFTPTEKKTLKFLTKDYGPDLYASLINPHHDETDLFFWAGELTNVGIHNYGEGKFMGVVQKHAPVLYRNLT